MKYLTLIKYKISLAVSFSAVIGYLLSGNIIFSELLLLIATVFLLASGASVLNQYQESEKDKLMLRTLKRPIPSGKIERKEALVISILLLLSGVLISLRLPIMVTILGILNVIIYNILYTRLKSVTQFAVIPGALVGAVPPVMGWYASAYSALNTEIIAFSLFMFLWQIPHFVLLALKNHNDYLNAGFKTINIKFNAVQLRNIMFYWVISTSMVVVMFPLVNLVNNIYLVMFLFILNLIFIYIFYIFSYSKNRVILTKYAFMAMNMFMLLVLGLLLINKIIL